MEYVKLKDVCLKIGSGSTPKGGASVYIDEGTSLIRSQNIYNLTFSYKGLAHINGEAANRLRSVTIKKNDVLINITGDSVARTCMVPDDVLPARVNQHVSIIRPNSSKLDPFYLSYYLASPFMQATMLNYATGKGSSRNAMTKEMIGNYLIPCPSIFIQKKIVGVLKQYDDLIKNNNKRIKLLEQMAENLYKEWFVRFRFPGYKDVEFMDGFPKKWEKVKLDDVLNKIATGLNPRKNFVLGEGENFYVTIKNMADNTVYLDDKCDKVNDDAIIKINKRSDLKIGDLLFSGIGTIGRVCLIDIPTNNWNISESVFTMRANKKISSEFLYMLLLSQDVQNYCQSKANGSAQKGIRMGDLRKYTFLLPTKNVINDFTNQISPILRNVSLLRNENKNLIQQRDMFLPRLMSGKLEV